VSTRLRTACAIAALATVVAARPFAAAGALSARSLRVGVASTLPHLRGVGEIRDWFNAGRGHVRLILLLSPT